MLKYVVVIVWVYLGIFDVKRPFLKIVLFFCLGVLKYVVCLCRACDGCCVFCLYCEASKFIVVRVFCQINSFFRRIAFSAFWSMFV